MERFGVVAPEEPAAKAAKTAKAPAPVVATPKAEKKPALEALPVDPEFEAKKAARAARFGPLV